jgi:hypothetical protein
MNNTVTISLEEFDRLRDFRKEFDDKKFYVEKEILSYAFGIFDNYHACTNDEAIKKLAIGSTKTIQELQSKIDSLKCEVRDLKMQVERKKRWF